MRGARSLVAAAGPAIALVVTWGALEAPVAWRGLVLAAALGLLPAAAGRTWLRAATAAVVAVAGLSAAFSVSPVSALPRTDGTWLGEIERLVEIGLRGFEVVLLPFDPAERPAMHALVGTAVLAFTLAVALAVASGRPLLAAAVVVVGGGWATASVPDHRLVLVGSLLLVAALWPSIVLHARAPRDAVAAAAVVVVLSVGAVGAASAGAAPDDAQLGWRSWSVFGDARERLGVSYVWEAQYTGIDFPVRPTTVLRIEGPRSAHYWRASTLDLFTADRWLENLYPIVTSTPSRPLPADPLLPAKRRAGDLVRQAVEVAALADDHLVATGQPLRLQSDVVDTVFFLSGGVMRVSRTLPRGTKYTVWSYAPRPSPRELLRSRPRYPAALERYLAFDRTVLPGFGEPGRAAVLNRILKDSLYRSVWDYRPLWEQADRLGSKARTPYEATLAVERWLRTTGGFRYEEHPPLAEGVPPLVGFVTTTKAGYCQHFAGTMALMLRLLGIPARVAVGFTSGKWDGKRWVVSDVDAHAWVEAWFDGFGWLAFDPTPGRGSFSASYTLASDSADAVRALGRGELLAVLPESDGVKTPVGPSTTQPAADAARAQSSAWPFLIVAAVLLLPALVLAVGKEAIRRGRYATRDPRRLAGAARAELVAVLRDQGVTVPDGLDMPGLRREVERHLGVPGGALAEAHARARYGPPGRALQAAADMRSELRTLRRVLREELGVRRRLRGALSLRSLRRA